MRADEMFQWIMWKIDRYISHRQDKEECFEDIPYKRVLTCMNVFPWSEYSWKGVEWWPVRLVMSSQPALVIISLDETTQMGEAATELSSRLTAGMEMLALRCKI